MEYERTEGGQIQAAFAERAGQLLVQYDHLRKHLPPDHQFEATLSIVLLQSILTMCHELMKNRRPKNPSKSLDALLSMAERSLATEPWLLGLSRQCILERWPSGRGVKYRDIVESIRNALSHPLPQKPGAFPRTGFTTELSGSGQVEAFVFTHSPWVNSTGSDIKPCYRPSKNEKGSGEKLRKENKKWETENNFFGLELVEEKICWSVFLNGSLFIPVCRIRLDVAQLRTFTLGLSDYLSEPIRQAASQKASEAIA